MLNNNPLNPRNPLETVPTPGILSDGCKKTAFLSNPSKKSHFLLSKCVISLL